MDRCRATTCTAIVALATITALAGTPHAQAETELIPPWVKSVFAYYVDGKITETELINALQYLIDQNIIRVSPAAPAPPPPPAAPAPPPEQHTAEWRVQAAIHRTDAALDSMVMSIANTPMSNEIEMPLDSTLIGTIFNIQKHINNTAAPIDDSTATAAERMATAAERMATAAERMAIGMNASIHAVMTASLELAFMPESDRILTEKVRDAELALLTHNFTKKMTAIDAKHATTDNMLTEHRISSPTMSEMADVVESTADYGVDMFNTATEFFNQSSAIFLKYADGVQ